MPGCIRPNKTAMKIAYKILKTPKDLRQRNEKDKETERRKFEWFKDTSWSR